MRSVLMLTLICWACSSTSTNQAPAELEAGPGEAGDAGELEAGDADAGELEAGDADAGELEAGDAGELEAGDDHAGELEAGDAGELEAGDDDAGELEAGDAGKDTGPVDATPDVSPWNGCVYFGPTYDPNCPGKFFVGCSGGASPAPAGCVYFAPYGSGSAFCCVGHP